MRDDTPYRRQPSKAGDRPPPVFASATSYGYAAPITGLSVRPWSVACPPIARHPPRGVRSVRLDGPQDLIRERDAAVPDVLDLWDVHHAVATRVRMRHSCFGPSVSQLRQFGL